MGADEESTLARLKAIRADIVDPAVALHHGRIFKTTGDGLLAEFASVVEAVRCAVAVPRRLGEGGAAGAAESRLALRIGVHVGDVIVDGDDIFGDGVNIAARAGRCRGGADGARRRASGDIEPAQDLGFGVAPRPVHDEFRRALAACGHIDGRTIEIAYRWCDGD